MITVIKYATLRIAISVKKVKSINVINVCHCSSPKKTDNVAHVKKDVTNVQAVPNAINVILT